jgi:hypothetical protein
METNEKHRKIMEKIDEKRKRLNDERHSQRKVRLYMIEAKKRNNAADNKRNRSIRAQMITDKIKNIAATTILPNRIDKGTDDKRRFYSVSRQRVSAIRYDY